jgi:hypothetical protein
MADDVERAERRVERLRSFLKGIEIALARDGNVDAAMKLVLEALADES